MRQVRERSRAGVGCFWAVVPLLLVWGCAGSSLPDGVPGLPTPQGIKNLMEYDVKAPLKIKEDIPTEKVMNLKLMREVKDELESKR